ncbi:MAG: VOC family protein [Actinomycetota bacterium]|nr:VOC family protein [Actinomycetota bacterium]
MIENRTMPGATVMPVLVYDDVDEACEWLCRVFGFTERWRAGSHRAQLELDGGALMIGDSRANGPGEPDQGRRLAPAPDGPISHSVMVRVTDIEQHFERSRDCGAQILHAPQDFPYGERQYNAIDLGGHHWTFSQSIADVAPEDWGGTSAA